MPVIDDSKRRAKRRRARNRVRGTLQAVRDRGPLSGLRYAVRNWSRMGRVEVTYADWVRRHATLVERESLRESVDGLAHRRSFSVIVIGLDGTDAADATASVEKQIMPAVERHLVRHADGADALNGVIERARGEWIVLLDAHDRLAEDALAQLALAAAGDAGVLYGDEDRITATGRRCDPWFKPSYDPEHMLGIDLIGRGAAYRADLARRIGGVRPDFVRPDFSGAWRYDLSLRCAREGAARHVSHVLCHRRTDAPEPEAPDELEAVRDHVRAVAPSSATVTLHPRHSAWRRMRWPVPDPAPLVSVIVPTRDAGHLVEPCVRGVLERTHYPSLELLLVDNGSTDPDSLATFRHLERAHPAMRTLHRPGPFNYSTINNDAVREAKGELILLLNNDIDVIEGDWLAEMVGLIARPGVGIVGAKLLFGNGRVQHAGVRLGMGGYEGGPGVAGHLALGRSRDEPGPHGAYALTRDVGAVTAACMLIRREAFETVGGLDEERLAVAFNDVDLCLKVREAGWRIVYAANAVLYHHESATRGSDTTPEKRERFLREIAVMRERWGPVLDRDPFYSRHFDDRGGDWNLNAPDADVSSA